jgi:hypothetical protein
MMDMPLILRLLLEITTTTHHRYYYVNYYRYYSLNKSKFANMKLKTGVISWINENIRSFDKFCRFFSRDFLDKLNWSKLFYFGTY